jgi:hypothetical protein
VRGSRRVFFALFALLAVVALLPVWSARVLPMLDIPAHLALVRGWHDIGDGSYRIAESYALRIRPVPYLLYYACVHGLMHVVSIETANKLVLSAYLLALPVSAATLARALGRSPWLGLGAFALAYNPAWTFGYASYLTSVPALFFALAALCAWLDRGERRALVGFAALSLLTYFGHVLTWGALAATTFVFFLTDRAPRARRAQAALSLAPSLALFVITLVDERASRAYAHGAIEASPRATDAFVGTWRTPLEAVAELPRRTLDIFPGHIDTAVLVVVTLATVVMAWKAGIGGSRRLLIVIAVVAAMWLLLPYEIRKPVVFFQISGRLPPLLATLCLLLPAVREGEEPRVVLAPPVVASLVLFGTLTVLYRDFDRRNRAFFSIVDALPRGTSTLVIAREMMTGEHPEEKSGDPATSAPMYWCWNSWPAALKGGYAPYAFDQGVPIVPVRRLVVPPFPPPDDLAIEQAPDFDFYLLRRPTDRQRSALGWREVRAAGEWVLFVPSKGLRRSD